MREEVLTRIRAGARFAGLYATGPRELRCLLTGPSGRVEVVRATADGPLPTLVDALPAADWDEREAHDLFGVEFAGREPLRPLVRHREPWRTPVTGEGVHEVAVGPIHAGIIESGHFRLHNVGERVLHLDLRLSYKHRGLEAAAESSALAEGIRFAQRACGACAVSNSLAYALAVEELAGLEATPETRRARTVLLELERLYNHLNDLSAICAGVGFAAGAMAYAALKERAQRLNRLLSGHRFLFGAVAVGGSRLVIEGGVGAASEVAAIEGEAHSAWREMMFNRSVVDRLEGVGVISEAEAERLGAVGPAARASGVDIDARTAAPALDYEGFTAARPLQAIGDVRARAEVRHHELTATAAILTNLLTQGVSPVPVRQLSEGVEGVAAARVESPRGETVCAVEALGGRVTRLHLRTASFANWPVVAAAVPGHLLPDFPLINKSFELCYACVDR